MYEGYYIFRYSTGGNLSECTLGEASERLIKELRGRLGTALEEFGDKSILKNYEEETWHETNMSNFIEDQGIEIDEVTSELLEQKGMTFDELKEFGW